MAFKDLGQAKDAKKDEFYTQLTDIEKELKHYTEHFKNKVVFCLALKKKSAFSPIGVPYPSYSCILSPIFLESVAFIKA